MTTTLFEPVTEEERDRRVAEALANYEACGEWAFLIADSNGHVAELAKAATSIIPMAPIPEARPMTQSEAVELDGDLIYHQIYGARADNPIDNLPECFRVLEEDRQAAEFGRLVGLGVAATKQAESVVSVLVEKALAKLAEGQRQFPGEHDREHLIVRTGADAMARASELAAADDSRSVISRMLSAHLAGSKDQMRAAVRQMLAA